MENRPVDKDGREISEEELKIDFEFVDKMFDLLSTRIVELEMITLNPMAPPEFTSVAGQEAHYS